MSYLVISRLRVEQFNMMQSMGILAPLPVFAAAMFGHAMGRKLSSVANGCVVTGVGLVLHAAQPKVEHLCKQNPATGLPYWEPMLQQKRSIANFSVRSDTNRADPASQPYQPHALADGEFTIVLQTEGRIDPKRLEALLAGGRLAGGRITGFQSVEHVDTLADVIQGMRQGYWVMDASRVVEQRVAEGADIVQAVLARLDTNGCDVPVTVGYSTLTPLETCANSRSGGLHAFAEPTLGLVRLLPVRALANGGAPRSLLSSSPIWKNQWKDEAPEGEEFSTFYLTQH